MTSQEAAKSWEHREWSYNNVDPCFFSQLHIPFAAQIMSEPQTSTLQPRSPWGVSGPSAGLAVPGFQSILHILRTALLDLFKAVYNYSMQISNEIH